MSFAQCLATRRGSLALLLAGIILFLATPSPAEAQWRIPSPVDGKSELRVGILAKFRAESRDTASSDDAVKDFYVRNLRILAGGRLTERLSLFFETDAPNLGRTGADGKKGSSDMFVQDFVLTYAATPDVFVDAGLLLTDVSYNHSQSAASHMVMDYGPYTFIESGPLDERVGRDYGVRLRGYAGNALEYRASVLSGQRGSEGTESYRYTFRGQWYPFDAVRGLFYPGTSHAKKKIVALGASYDGQDDYSAVSGNLYGEIPTGSGNAVTWLVESITFDGGDFLESLPEQTTTLVQAGFYIGSRKLTPWMKYAERDYDDAMLADEERLQFGLSWFPYGHLFNLKAAWERLEIDGSDDLDRFSLQMQIFAY